MYMEAYGSVGNWADSVIKKSLVALTTKNIAEGVMTENALSKQGVSPSSEGGSVNATPNTDQEKQIADLNKELQARDKAQKSLEKKIANWKAKAEYRNSLIKLQQKELWKYQKKEMVGDK